VLVPASARTLVLALASELDVPFERITTLPAERTALTEPKIAGGRRHRDPGPVDAVPLSEVLGLDITPVTAAGISGGTVDLNAFDVLLTAEGQLTSSNLGVNGNRELREFLAAGGGLVTYGAARP
jgi:hypothetical protein